LIVGAAGTGKTFLVSKFVESLDKKYKVLVLAPTHKALDVLKSYFSDTKNVTFKTIHSALKLKPQFVDDKKVFLPAGKPILDDFDYVIIDEASMIKKREAEMLLESRSKLIFLGDKYQLPPVNEEESIIFNEVDNKIELKEIKRQSNGNPIVEISKNPEGFLDFLAENSNFIANDSGIAFCKDKDFIARLVASINDPDKIIFLAYRNKTVRSFNNRVKEELNLKELITEKTPIILLQPYKRIPGSTIIKPYSVQKLKRTFFVTDDKGEPKEFLIRFYRINHNIDILAPVSEKDFARMLKMAKKTNFKLYQRYSELFAWWDYAWAITVHKSQGSSFQSVIVDLQDILKSDEETKKKLAYVALTRARILNIIVI